MAINKWQPTETTAAQVDTFTPVNVGIGNVFTLTMTGYDGTVETVSYTAAAATVADVTAGLETAWNTSTGTLISTLTAADGTTVLTLTADTAGVAFKVLGTATGGTADITEVNTTENAGPNSWDDPTNWSEGTIPGATAAEDTFVENSNVDILYGLDQSGASNVLNTLHITKTYTGKIGWNGSGSLIGDYLQLKTAKAFIGEFSDPGTASGSGRIKLDFGTTACDVIVYDLANPVDSNKQAFRMLANNAATDIKEIRSGSVGIAAGTGETSTIGDVLVSYETSRGTDAVLVVGAGVTMADLNCIGGQTSLKCAATNVTSKGGTLVISGTGTIGTLEVDGGAVKPVSGGTITTCKVKSGSADFTASAEARTVTTMELTSGTLQFDREVVTITNETRPESGAGRVQWRSSNI